MCTHELICPWNQHLALFYEWLVEANGVTAGKNEFFSSKRRQEPHQSARNYRLMVF
jgi:hypothetical protein